MLTMKYFVLSSRACGIGGMSWGEQVMAGQTLAVSKPQCPSVVFSTSSSTEVSETIPTLLTRYFYTVIHIKHFFCMSCLRAL